MRVAVAQMDLAWERPKENFEKASALAGNAAEQGADFLVLPEMFSTGFSMKPEATVEPEDGPTAAFLKSLANEHAMGVLGGLTLPGKTKEARNAALAVGRGGETLAVYAKTYLFKYMGEDAHHEPGDGPVPFDFDDMRCAAFICYDLRFPELFREAVDNCHLYFVIASWPEARQSHFDTLLRARAVENQLYVVGANRIGKGGGLSYKGGSCIIAPDGEVLAHGGAKEGLVIADVSAERVVRTRQALPFLQDRRV
jgi:predicted amidohydrolase